jgi:hypothetical protein
MNKIQPALAIGALLSISTGLFAEENKPLGQINDYLRLTGELEASYESWNYFQPNPAIANNAYDVWELRARLGLMLTTPYVDGYVQGQYIGLYNLPTDATAPPSVGPLGLGGAYFSANNSAFPQSVFLRQAYLNFKLSRLGLTGGALKVGRFEFADGMEYKSGDKKFDGLKTMRISQRLLGSNAVYATRSFDGFSTVYDNDKFNFTATAMRPTQGGFDVHGQDEISKLDLFYSAVTSKKNALLPDTEGRLFYIYYHDQRGTTSVDNRSVPQRQALNQDALNLHTIGGHLLTLQNSGSNSFDGLLWGAYQFGDWTNQSHSAYAFDAEIGYQRTDLPLKPWIRGVYNLSSGDGNTKDGQHNTFFSMLPSGRRYANFPFYNLMNLQDTFAQLILSPSEKTRLSIDFHHLQLANTNDLFYGGLGASSRSGAFGYIGRPGGGNRNVGQLVDFTINHEFTKQLSARFYYAHAFGGSVIKNVYPAKTDADMAWVELNASF